MLSARCEENQECSNNIWSENTNKYLVDGYFMRDEPSLTSSVAQLKLYMQKKGGGGYKKKKRTKTKSQKVLRCQWEAIKKTETKYRERS